jgi:hypothetical protein
MAVTPRIHDVAKQEAAAFEERHPGYQVALVKALDDVIGHQAQPHLNKRREDVTKVVEALGLSAVVATQEDTDAP